MIAKARAISHGAAYAEYITGKDKAVYIGGEHLLDDGLVLGQPDLEEIWEEFRWERLNRPGREIKNNIIAMEISPTPEEMKGMTNEDLLKLARQTLDYMDEQAIAFSARKKKKGETSVEKGIVPQTHLRDSKWFAMLHKDSASGIFHLHLIVSRFTADGENINDTRLIAKRAARAAEAVNRHRGWGSAVNIQEQHVAVVKELIYDVLRAMTRKSFSWEDFQRAVEARTFIDYKGREQHYAVNFRRDSCGRVVGYSIGRGNTWYNAGDIGRQLTAKRMDLTFRIVRAEQQEKHRAEESRLQKQSSSSPVKKVPVPAREPTAAEKERQDAIRDARTAIREVVSRSMPWHTGFNRRDIEDRFPAAIAAIAIRDAQEPDGWRSEQAIEDAARTLANSVAIDSQQDFQMLLQTMMDVVLTIALPPVTPSVGGGGTNNDLPKKKDDDWMWWKRNGFCRPSTAARRKR